MRVYLETERLVLRRLTEDDARLLEDLDSDPMVMRYLTGGRPTPLAVIQREVLPGFMAWYATTPGYGFWASVDKVEREKFLGWFHLRPPADGSPDTAELGYRLRREVWGQGYATEGSRALVVRAFNDLGARRVVAYTMAINHASRRVMEKAGLRFVRTFFPTLPPIPGSEEGEVEYALAREEYATRGFGSADDLDGC